jgi:3D (Asp-Asp-Asp) domain-containing protein
VRLRVGHCAVDPRRIPYGSKVILLDGVYTAVDTGRAVINRKAARRAGRTASERNALVIDCFFETKRQALSWANAHPAFMTVQVVAPNCYRTTTAQHPQVSKQSAPQVAAGTVPQIKRIVGGKQPTPQIAAGTVPQTKQVVSGKQLAQQVGAGTVPQPKQVVGGKQLAQQVGAGTVPQPKQIAGGKQLAERVAAGKVPQTKRIVGVDPGPGVDRSRR